MEIEGCYSGECAFFCLGAETASSTVAEQHISRSQPPIKHPPFYFTQVSSNSFSRLLGIDFSIPVIFLMLDGFVFSINLGKLRFVINVFDNLFANGCYLFKFPEGFHAFSNEIVDICTQNSLVPVPYPVC